MSRQSARVIILGLFLVSLSFLASAQANRKDVVYLKNGSIIKGFILEIIPNATIKIETADGSIFIFKMEEIEKTEKEEKVSTDKTPRTVVNEMPKEKADLRPTGYFIIARFGPKVSPAESDALDVSVGIINGIHVNEYVSFGVGLEASSFTFGSNLNSSIPVFPVFLDTRLYIPRERVNPMFGFQLGYSFTGNATLESNQSFYGDFVPGNNSGGLYMAACAGLRIAINKRFSVLGDIGFAFQKLKGNTYNSYYDSNTGTYLNTPTPATHTTPFFRLNVGLCVSFGK
jgi:hypothetical protein